jgi:hypothetical protein
MTRRFHDKEEATQIFEKVIELLSDEDRDILQIHKLITEEEGMVVDGGYAGIPGKNVIRKQRGKLSSDDIIWNNKIEAV